MYLVQETEDYDGVNLEGLQEEFEGNKDAARALMRVKQKLDGYEGGEMRSIHGQVSFFWHFWSKSSLSRSWFHKLTEVYLFKNWLAL